MLVAAVFVTALALVGAGEPEQQIVGGEDAEPHSWPWQISLRIVGFHICGASIIARNYVVTAAHCVDWAPPPYFYVVAGANSLIDPADSEQVLGVEEVFLHPDWIDDASQAFPNDIAVLKLNDSFVWTSEVQQAYIRGAPFEYEDEASCYITGWGLTQGGGEFLPEFLQQTVTTVLSTEECREYFGSVITDNHICIFDKQTGGQTGACNGDSGGPLVCKRKGHGPYFLVGVTSFVVRGCKTEYPSGYTRISSYFHWIRQTMDAE